MIADVLEQPPGIAIEALPEDRLRRIAAACAALGTAAILAGTDAVGRISHGCRADLVTLDQELRVSRVRQGGTALPKP